jgi:hypothetical protein
LLIIGCVSTLGSALALAVGKFFTPALYGVSPKDPETYLISLALMGAIGLIACYVPARRALRIDARSRPARRVNYSILPSRIFTILCPYAAASGL